jgi:hypothetical protein
VRRFPSGRCQARYLDPETHRFTPPPQTFATKGAADRWLNRKRAELDAGTAIDEKAGSEPLSHWWPGYWRSLQSRKPTTRVNHSTAWRLRIAPRFGTLPVRGSSRAHRRLDRPHEPRRCIADEGDRGCRRAETCAGLEGEVAVRIDLAIGLCPHQSPLHFYVSRMWNQPTEEANMAATSS